MSSELVSELEQLPMHLRRRYLRMDAGQRAEFHSQFRRHITVCRKHGMAADPSWVREVLQDINESFSTIGV